MSKLKYYFYEKHHIDIVYTCIVRLHKPVEKQSDESEETAFVLDSTIRIGDAIEKALPSMKLSKVVDSIVYVPLETKYI